MSRERVQEGIGFGHYRHLPTESKRYRIGSEQAGLEFGSGNGGSPDRSGDRGYGAAAVGAEEGGLGGVGG